MKTKSLCHSATTSIAATCQFLTNHGKISMNLSLIVITPVMPKSDSFGWLLNKFQSHYFNRVTKE